MFHGIVLAAALACSGHTFADLQEAVAAPPADVMAPLTAEDQKILGAPKDVTIYLIQGPGVGDGKVIVVFAEKGCVIDMMTVPTAEFEDAIGKHQS